MHCPQNVSLNITTSHHTCPAQPFNNNAFGNGYHIIPTLTVIWLVITYSIIRRTIHNHLTLRGPRFTLLGFLALFDCMFCVVQCVFFYVNIYMDKTPESMILFKTLKFLLHTSLLNSTSMTMLITVNQFISVKYAIKYHKIVTNRRLYISIATVTMCCYVVYFITYIMGLVIYMFAVYFSLLFIVMTTLMTFIFCTARAAISAIMKTKSQAPEVPAEDFLPKKMKRLFSDTTNVDDERKKKEKEMKSSEQLACISIVTMFLIGTLTGMSIRGILSTIQYSDVKVYMTVASLYSVLNPLIYVSTMSEVRFFVKKDFADWRDFNSIKLPTRARRRVTPKGV